MKAAYGSTPSVHRHRGNNPNNSASVSVYSGSQSTHKMKMVMPPFLRLDSTGEIASDDGPVQSTSHLRTMPNAKQCPGTTGVTNGFLGKFVFQITPRVTPSSQHLITPQVAQGGMNALDELIHNRQALNRVAKTGMRSHAQMAQSKYHRGPSRYGQWGVMSPNYPCLPRGVFPCHVFRALQTQTPHMWPPVTGSPFVHKTAWMHDSLADACEKFTTPKTIHRQCSKSTVENSCDTYSSEPQCDYKSLSTDIQASGVEKSVCTTTSSHCITGVLNCDLNMLNTHHPQEKQVGIGNQNMSELQENLDPCSISDQNQTFLGHMVRKPLSLSESESISSEGSLQNQSYHEEECAHSGRTKTDLCAAETENLKTEDGSELGACGRNPVVQQSNATSGEEEDSLADWYLDEDDEDNNDEIDEDQAESWKSFEKSCLSFCNFFSTSKQHSKDEEEEELSEEKFIPKPHPGANRRWDSYYTCRVPAYRPRKVQFSCGEGQDQIHTFEKGDDEFLTVMEMQVEHDRSRKHQGRAAELLRKRHFDEECEKKSVHVTEGCFRSTSQVPTAVPDCVDVCDGVSAAQMPCNVDKAADGDDKVNKEGVAKGSVEDDDDSLCVDGDIGLVVDIEDLEDSDDEDDADSESEEEGKNEEEEDDDDDDIIFA